MYFDFMPGDLLGGDNIFDDEKSIIWVNDFSQAVCINDLSICVKLHFQIAAFFRMLVVNASLSGVAYEY